MTIKINDIVEAVLVRLDESPEILDDAIEYGSSQFDLRALVRSLMVEEAERVLTSVSRESFGEWLPLIGAVSKIYARAGSYRRVLTLPDDFLRLVYVRMSDWGEAVTRVTDPGDVSVSLRRHWLRRGGANHFTPAVTFTYNDGSRALEIFGSVDGSRVADGGYIPRPVVVEKSNLLFPPSLSGELIDRLVETIKHIRA